MKTKETALSWWRDKSQHEQWLAIERWRLLKESGCDWPAAIIINSRDTIARIWRAEKAREFEKASQAGGEKFSKLKKHKYKKL